MKNWLVKYNENVVICQFWRNNKTNKNKQKTLPERIRKGFGIEYVKETISLQL